MNYMNSVYVNVLLIILNVFCTSNHKTVQNLAAKSLCLLQKSVSHCSLFWPRTTYLDRKRPPDQHVK